MLWFAVPFSMATTIGLAGLALDLPMSASEIGQALVPPAVAYHLLGKVNCMQSTPRVIHSFPWSEAHHLIMCTSVSCCPRNHLLSAMLRGLVGEHMFRDLWNIKWRALKALSKHYKVLSLGAQWGILQLTACTDELAWYAGRRDSGSDRGLHGSDIIGVCRAGGCELPGVLRCVRDVHQPQGHRLTGTRLTLGARIAWISPFGEVRRSYSVH